MTLNKSIATAFIFSACCLVATAGFAADYPAPQKGSCETIGVRLQLTFYKWP